MPKINVLEKHVAELIAAGEVIERPASIVKELLENSIDAGATAVTVEIKNGGIRYIRITDNGCGIVPEDVPTAFLRHATSKVQYEYDLDSIGTLGFRGEALASVCAVARVEMLTKTPGTQFGTRIELEGGEQLLLEEAGCPDGTTIVVRDLFYNVPARLKFLKRDVYEAGLVTGIAEKIALSHPDISVKLIKDGKVELHTPGNGDIKSAIYAVFGKEFANTLMPVGYTYQDVRVHGFASIPDLSKANRKSQHFFVNGRYVKSRTCAGALEEAYRHSIMVGKFPACILYFEVPADTVDVNVHPTKTEVRFINERTVYDAVYFAIKSAISEYNKNLLQDNFTAERQKSEKQYTFSKPNLDYVTKAREIVYSGEQTVMTSASSEENGASVFKIGDFAIQRETAEIVRQVKDDTVPEYRCNLQSNYQEKSELKQSDLKHLNLDKIFDSAVEMQNSEQPDLSEKLNMNQKSKESVKVEQNVPEEQEEIEDVSNRIKLCGELFKTYILAEFDNQFLIVDKHAAHERILYEKLRSTQGDIDAQLLLTPLTVTLPREDYLALLECREKISQYGFDVEDFGKCSVQVRAIPMFLDTFDATQVLYELGCSLRKNKRDISPELIDDMLHSIACKAAIKAHDDNSEEELRAIVKEVCQNENIRYCPHGRPVVITMSKYELEKKFHRIV